MRKRFIFLLAVLVGASGCAKEETDGLVLIEGGTFINAKSNYFGKKVTVPDFYIGKYEVTQKEWIKVMGNNPSKFKGDNLPVESVNWYDAVEYCNKRSVKEGLRPYYNIDKNKKDPDNTNDLDTVKWTVTVNDGANGYRLPTEVEWEYAAGGGRKSKSFTYSGGDDIDKVAWYWRNTGDKPLTGNWSWTAIEKNNSKTKPVGLKKPNELGLYDMSGNVREWVWDWHERVEGDNGSSRIWRGGGWIGGEHACITSYRGKFEANGKGPDQGLRVVRSKLTGDT